MKCPYCNIENPPEESYCTDCGSPLKTVSQVAAPVVQRPVPGGTIQCPHCGKSHPAHLSGCPETGRDLPTSGSTPMPPFVRRAKLLLENDEEIFLPLDTTVVKRDDFKRFVSPEELQYISKHHCTIYKEDESYFIEDNASKNGTLLNGAEIQNQGRQPLKDGDQIEIGKVIGIVFKTR